MKLMNSFPKQYAEQHYYRYWRWKIILRVESVKKLDSKTKLTFGNSEPQVTYTDAEYKYFREKVLQLITINKLTNLVGLTFDWEIENSKLYPIALIEPNNPIETDVHEPQKIFERLLPNAVMKSLKFGDYNFIGLINSSKVQISIERKEAGDLVTSITSGELAEQVRKMNDNAKVKILLREGFITATSDGKVRTKARTHGVNWSFLWDSIMTLQLKYNLALDESPNDYFTPKRIRQLYAYFQKPTHFSDERVMKLNPVSSIRSINVLSSFDGYAEGTAKKVLKQFGTLRNYLNADDKSREEMPGIGRVKARIIDETLDEIPKLP